MDHPVVLFDNICRLCDASVNWIIAHDHAQKFRFASAQSETGIRLREYFRISELDSLILVEGENFFTRSSAALRIARMLGLPWSLLSILMLAPPFLRDALYDTIASHRYLWFGKLQTCAKAAPELKERFLN